MNGRKLIAMANQIGAFFAAMPDRDQAVRDIALHLERSWAPSMRREIIACLESAAGQTLHPMVREAVLLLAAGMRTESQGG